ncbi:hypothetical protein JCM10914A_39630 [Paenibacillus sp. JCM 10914]|uniref:hypothetical protein n=1 Tax=Paenibacillus sp. JCM 10914 TaxID=1236974 RepID=UPI0003CC9BCB|nr:hypothetical protein [Paenibacillus sp. JCM 10914]GAE04686.1 hypothetical protein JCM10914_741 [Paenibacillus sp. JCM 10914]
MNLADMLTYADIGQLSNIANHYDCDAKRNSKHELIQSILSKLGRREFFEELVASLSPSDMRFLNNLVFDTRTGYSLEELTAAIRQSSEMEQEVDKSKKQKTIKTESPREIVARYRRSGWLFNGFTHSTKYLFQVPSDLKERFRDVLRERLHSRLQPVTRDPEVYRDEQGLAVEDLLLILKYVRGHDIDLNQEGFMYRRNQQLLMSTLHISEPLITKGAWRFGYGRSCIEYPDRFAMLYDYAFARQWVRESNGKLLLTEAGSSVLEEGNQVSVVQLFRFWLRLYKGAIPNIASIIYWISQCSHEWVTAASLQESLSWLIRPFYYDSPQNILVQRIVRMLMHLGMLRIGESESQGTCYRMTALGLKIAETSIHIKDNDAKGMTLQ